MKADRVTVGRYGKHWIAKFMPDREYSRSYSVGRESLNRLMDLCNGDTVNVLHFIGLSGIGLEIHRNKPRHMPVSDPRSAAWKAGKDNRAAYPRQAPPKPKTDNDTDTKSYNLPRFRPGPVEIITTDRPMRFPDDDPSLTAGERNAE